MEAAAPRHHADTVLFEDGLGQRLPAPDDATRVERHVLVVRGALAAGPSFEFQLRERVDRLSGVRHPHLARALDVRTVPGGSDLSVLFEAPAGFRLSELLRNAQARQVPVGINAALSVVRQLAPALAALQEGGADLAHGALAAERLVITPDARVIVLDHVLGAALEQLRYSRERYWSELRVAVPPSATPRLDQRADVLQLGLTALALILGRPIRLEEFPSRIPDVVASTAAVSPNGGFEPLPAGVRGWLARALQIGPERPFARAAEARDAFDRILGNGELLASPSELASFLSRYASADPVHGTRVPPDRAALPLRVPSSGGNPQPTLAGRPPLQLEAAQTAQVPANDADVLALAAPVSTHRPRASAARSPLAPRRFERSAAVSDCAEPADADWTAHLDDPDAPRWWWNWRLVGAFVLLAGIVSASGSLGAARQLLQLVDSSHGTLELTSIPAGADVFVDGVQKGTTPLVVSVASGAHDVELRVGRMRRAFGVIVASGEKVRQQVKLQRTDVKGARGAKTVSAARPRSTTADVAVAVSTAGTWPHANALRVGDALGERSALPPPQLPGSIR